MLQINLVLQFLLVLSSYWCYFPLSLLPYFFHINYYLKSYYYCYSPHKCYRERSVIEDTLYKRDAPSLSFPFVFILLYCAYDIRSLWFGFPGSRNCRISHMYISVTIPVIRMKKEQLAPIWKCNFIPFSRYYCHYQNKDHYYHFGAIKRLRLQL